MTNPMIERVAKTIFDEFCPGVRYSPEDQREYAKVARKVIEALRDTPKICYDNFVCDKLYSESNATEIFNKWIDAALKE